MARVGSGAPRRQARRRAASGKGDLDRRRPKRRVPPRPRGDRTRRRRPHGRRPRPPLRAARGNPPGNELAPATQRGLPRRAARSPVTDRVVYGRPIRVLRDGPLRRPGGLGAARALLPRVGLSLAVDEDLGGLTRLDAVADRDDLESERAAEELVELTARGHRHVELANLLAAARRSAVELE